MMHTCICSFTENHRETHTASQSSSVCILYNYMYRNMCVIYFFSEFIFVKNIGDLAEKFTH
uniref:Uncharacterized protein n=1 Tax=Octopus bimaculoides TaxID=37653 RepID=A0A0L8GCE0_OCTBM